MTWINLSSGDKRAEKDMPQSHPILPETGEALWRAMGYVPLTAEIQAQLDAEAEAKALVERLAAEAAARLASVIEWIMPSTMERRLTKDMPRDIGASFNCKAPQWIAAGWRGIVLQEQVPEGFRATAWKVTDDDGATCNLAIASAVNIAAEAEAQAIAEQQAYIADLNRNGKYYTLQNAYLLLCESVTGKREKIAGETMAVIIQQTKQADAKQGDALESAFSFLSQAMTYYSNKWWDEVQYRDVPELVKAAQDLIALKG